MNRVNILVVDDKMECIPEVQAILNSPSYNIVAATSVRDAFRYLESLSFAAIIIHIQMTSIKGFEVASMLRAKESFNFVPIIFVSSEKMDDCRMYQGYGSGAIDVLTMPVDPYILRSKIAILVELFRRNILKVENYQREADEAIKLRNEFLTVASHELNTPITSLKLQLQMLRRSLDKNQEIEKNDMEVRIENTINASIKQVDRLISLVQIIVDVSRLEEGDFNFVFSPSDMNLLIQEVAEKFKEMLSNSNSELILKMSPDLSMVWDKTRIEQMITNLLINAIKYAPGKIELAARPVGSSIIIELKDHGNGIPEHKLKKIFDRFERATTNESVSGLGLGLFIVKKIVEGHMGKIEVKSSPEEGTTFRVILPKDVNAAMEKHQAEPSSENQYH